MSEPADRSDAAFWGDADDGEARRRYRSLLNSLDEGVFRLDGEGRIVAVNDAFVDLSGFDRTELGGEDVTVLFGDDGAAIADAVDRGGATSTDGTDGSDPIRCTLERADGATVGCTVRVDGREGTDDAAETVCIVRRSPDDGGPPEQAADEDRRDVDRKRDLKRYETIVETVSDGVYAVDQNGRFTAVNRAYAEMLGYDRAELVGEHVSLVVDDDVLALAQQTEAAMVDGEMEGPVIEAELQTADGGSVTAEGTFAMLPDVDGETRRVGVVRDVTERKRLEAELDDVFGRVTDAFFALDESWTFTYVNEHAQDLINPEGREIEGESIWDAFPAAVGREFEEQYRRAMDEQVTVSFEEYYPDPLDRWFEVHAYPSETGLSVYFQDVTERKRRERALEESERRYRALAEYFPNGIVTLFDHDLEYTLAAGQGFDRIPIDPEDVEGAPLAEAWDEATAEALEPLFEAALDGEERSVDLSYAGREWVVHAAPVTDDDGDVFAGMTMSQDITERKDHERELAKYETIVETINDGIYVKDADGYFTMVNEAYAEMTGYDRAELVGAHASLVVDEETIDQSEVMRSAAEAEETNPTMEAAIQTADGDEVPAEGTFATIPAEDGEAKRVGVVRDITERKEQRRRIEESERRYRTLAEHFPNGAVGVFDTDLRFTVAEGAVLGDSLPSPDRLEGTRVPDLFSGETAADIEPLFRAAVEDGETHTTETELAGRHWQVWATPLRDADGDVFAGLSFAQDVTDQVEREQRLEELVEKLEASNERLEQFAYAASHDLQEPLRMVSSYLRLIEQRYGDELDADGEEFIDYAVDGADRMRDMIEGLLQYSRVDTGGDAFEPVDLSSVLTDVREDLTVRIDETDADIDVEDLPVVEGDGGQLRQVFQNLLDNAIEYSGDGPPETHVRAERAGDEWRISVSDDGIGIDPADRGRVFEVFQRLHAPDDHSGTGIGLALCERIVERHGGDIWGDSEPGEGATFTFTLPAAGERDA
jgi:PAS domain S-box-containing protein